MSVGQHTAIADGRAVAREICRREGVDFIEEQYLQKEGSRNDYLVKRSTRIYPERVSCPPVENRDMKTIVNISLTGDQAREEAKRCLDCDEFCGLCQTVCPNRANLIYEVTPIYVNLDKYEYQNRRMEKTGKTSFSIEQQSQIVNIAEFCNECGNCQTFCPTAGAPYQDKPRLCLTQKVFEEEETQAYRLETHENGWSIAGKDGSDYVHLNVSENGMEYISGKVVVKFDLNLKLQEIKAGSEIREGDRINLEGCVELYVMGKGLIESAGYLAL